MELRVERIPSLSRIEPKAWNTLAGSNPFLRHEFLLALEHSGAVGPGTAWEPVHVVAYDSTGLAGALPLYLKYDSRGEFVFDWGWADAYQRSGLAYYPKLVCSVPFTPATGERLLIRPGADADRVADRLLTAARAATEEFDASSLHVLFPADGQCAYFEREPFLRRKGCQFHWHNDGYTTFDDFLSRFSSAKRKKARRERRRIEEAGISFQSLLGNELSRAEWDAVFDFYSRTFMRRGRPPYLDRPFFDEIAETMPENVVVILGRYRRQPVASAICFRGGDSLYGRYWGSVADFHSLHFETCYYQGIEYCIREGLARFEPGTQGEHKISRGFTPHATWSYHWLREPRFHAAVADFVSREQLHVDAYMDELEEHLPYRADGPAPAA